MPVVRRSEWVPSGLDDGRSIRSILHGYLLGSVAGERHAPSDEALESESVFGQSGSGVRLGGKWLVMIDL
jgi:hypothetical protein